MPIENVRSSEPSTFTAYAATSVESRPPLRKAPTGTSLVRWRATVSPSISSTCSRISGSLAVSLGPKFRSQ